MLTRNFTINRSGGAAIYLLGIENAANGTASFCCGQVEKFNNTCITATRESKAAFFIEAGLMIFNRMSGSTSPQHKYRLSYSHNRSNCRGQRIRIRIKFPLQPQYVIVIVIEKRREAAMGAGMGGLLGFILLVTLGFLWRERKHKQSLKKDVQT